MTAAARQLPPRVSWVEETALMRAKPGQWVVLAERRGGAGRRRDARHGVRSMIRQIDLGLLWAFQPAGDYEGRANGWTVEARYLGDGSLQ